MKKLLMILTVTAFAVVANAGDACCASKKEAVSATTCSTEKAAACTSAQAAACSAKATTCSATATTCNKNGQKVASKQLKSPRHASQS
jgi:hypothetical protein